MMFRSTHITAAIAVLASSLALAPAALADPPYGDTTGGDTTGVGLMYASTVKAPATSDTTGTGILHASMVEAEVAHRATLVRTESGFQWGDAAVGAAAGFGAALSVIGAAAAIRNRRSIAA